MSLFSNDEKGSGKYVDNPNSGGKKTLKISPKEEGGVFCRKDRIDIRSLTDDEKDARGFSILGKSFVPLDSEIVLLQSSEPIMTKKIENNKIFVKMSSLVGFSKGVTWDIHSSENLHPENMVVKISGTGTVYKTLNIV